MPNTLAVHNKAIATQGLEFSFMAILRYALSPNGQAAMLLYGVIARRPMAIGAAPRLVPINGVQPMPPA